MHQSSHTTRHPLACSPTRVLLPAAMRATCVPCSTYIRAVTVLGRLRILNWNAKRRVPPPAAGRGALHLGMHIRASNEVVRRRWMIACSLVRIPFFDEVQWWWTARPHTFRPFLR
jgi:hypothetical protein